ncbi:MAG: putative AlkP superfamily phosphohydrolase/phosphomutase [Planctomycetota bacterium]|jgi:predicted AlkP superfamily phosphohydrolase/phosphomutase
MEETRGISAWRLLGIFLGVVAVVALLLTIMVIKTNPASFSAGAVLELALAMGLIALAVNSVLLGFLVLAWMPLRLVTGKFLVGRRGAYLLGGLVACNLVWCMWNRLTMANSLSGGKVAFLTLATVLEVACLLAVGLGVVLAFVGMSPRADGGRAGKTVALASILTLAGVAVAFTSNARGEGARRLMSHADIVSAAEIGVAQIAVGSGEVTLEDLMSVGDSTPIIPTASAGRRVITIGADGLDWSVAMPLMKQGKLPNLARFVEQGAAGYLDNGNESYSPIIWTTIFTGLPGRVHGVFDFQKAVLRNSGAGISNPLLMSPTIDSFYGLKMFLGNSVLQRFGLWDMAWVGARDRRVPTVWDVASHYDKQVAICDALANIPARPINGAIINLGREKGGGSSAYYPPELRELWSAKRMADPVFDPRAVDLAEQRFQALSTRFGGEVTFALDVLDEFGTDFCFYYTYFVDSQCHSEWNFYGQEKLFLDDRPAELDSAEWEAFLEEHGNARALRAYSVLDEQLGRFRERFPEALFAIVSDHGWTFSGYEHFNSPDGVVLFSGPGVKAGLELNGVHIQDIAPTLLALLGVPISDEFPGRIVSEAFEFKLDPGTVPNYRDVDMSFPTGARMEVSSEEEQRLRDIGYVR